MQNVDLGGSYGIVAFPDEYSPEDIVREYDALEAARTQPPPRAADLTVGDYARQVSGSLIRGLGNTLASVPEGIAIARKALPGLLPPVVRSIAEQLTPIYDPGKQIDTVSRLTGGGVPTTDTMLRSAASGLRAGTKAVAPEPVPELQESFLASRVPEGVGSALGFAAGGLAGRAARIPLWLSVGGAGSAAGGSEFYNDAKAHGADEPTANLASVVGNVVGTSEAFPLARMMKRLDGVTGNTFSRFVIESAKDTLEEALQEGVQRLAQNVTAQQLYDKDRALFDEVATNAGVGGVTGFLMSALTQALGIPIGRSQVRRESRDESRERIARVVAQRESEANATTGSGAVPAPTGQEEAVRQEADEQVRVRGATQPIESEAERQVPVAVFAGYQFGMADQPTYQIPGARPGILRNVSADAARAAGYEVPPVIPTFQEWQAAQGSPITPPTTPTPEQAVVQEAIDTTFAPQPQEAPMAFVGRVVRDVVTGWQNAPDIQLVDNGGQLPQEVQAKASADGVSLNDVDAVRDSRGTVWIVADKVKSEDHARRLLLHEAVGHEGVDRAFGNEQEWTTFMQGVAHRHAATQIGAEIRELYGADPVTIGKEIVAKLAENPGADPTLWQQIVAAVRNWARRVFKVDITDSDIRVLLLRGRRAVEGRPVAARPAGTSFAIAENESDYVPQDVYRLGLFDPEAKTIQDEAYDFAHSDARMAYVTDLIKEAADKNKPQARKLSRASPYVATVFNITKSGTVKGVGDLHRWLDGRIDGTGSFTAETIVFLDAILNTDPEIAEQLRLLRWSGRDNIFVQFLAKKLSDDGYNVDYFSAKAVSEGNFNVPTDPTEVFKHWKLFRAAVYDQYPALGYAADILLNYDSPAQQDNVAHLNDDIDANDAAAKQFGKTSFAIDPTQPSPSFFPRRASVVAATSNPGLSPSQIQEAEDLAAVQANMVTPDIVQWLVKIPDDRYESRAQKRLEYLLGRATLSPTPRPLSSFPEGTDEERRTKELAGAMQLSHYAVDRNQIEEIYRDIAKWQGELLEAMAKAAKTTQLQQHKANYLTAVFHNLTEDMGHYLLNLRAAAPASGNLQAQWKAKLDVAEARLNHQEQSPQALKNALGAIARTIPEAILTDLATNNQTIVDWVIQQGALFNVVGQGVQDWLLQDDGMGQPALLGYTRLIPDLQTLQDILTKEVVVQADIDAFQAWFKNEAVGPKVSAKAFAEKYFKFRTGRDRALKIVAANEKEIDRLDEKIRAAVKARDKLEEMMATQPYRDAVTAAAASADIVIISLLGPNNPRGVGLIDRDSAHGSWKMKGPISGEDYTVDLHPSTGLEKTNMENLRGWVAEARAWAIGHTESNPLLAGRYNDLATFVERNLMHPSMDPKQGFTLTRARIPFTNWRLPIDPFDGITSVMGEVGYSFQTVRDVLERIGGRVMRQAFIDAAELDTVMRKVEAADQNPEYGRAAQTAAVLKAIESHGWGGSHRFLLWQVENPLSDQSKRWDEEVAEPVLASGQNRLSPIYEVGDVIVGSDTKLTKEDVAALKLMKRWGDAIIAAAPHSIQDRLSDLGITRKAIGNGKFTVHRIEASWTRNFAKAWNEAKDDAAREKILTGPDEFRRVVLGYLAEYNVEFDKMNPANSSKSPLFELYRRLADTEKMGVQKFRTMQEVIDFLAEEGVERDIFEDYITAATTIHSTLLAEIKEFIRRFDLEVINFKSEQVWGAVPPQVVNVISAQNAFTTPRSRLVAPSTFYSYSTASSARQQRHVGSLRSFLNLKLLQSGHEATKALESKKAEMEDRIKALTRTGLSESKAGGAVQKETARDRALGEIRFDYREIVTALQAIEQSFGQVERYELANSDHYQHAGVAAANSFFSTVKSSLLSSMQAVTTNFWSGAILGPALVHWQTGQFGRAVGDVVLQPAIMAKALTKRVAAMVAGNKMMAKLLTKHAPLWNEMAEAIIKASADWRRVQQIAQSSGMVNPYNLGTVLRNMGELKRNAGRIVNDDPHRIAQWVNAAMSAWGVRHVAEGLKATIPRSFDNAINYMMVINFDREMDMLKKVGWAAFKARETAAAATGANWRDINNKDNTLTPGDLGLKTHKGLESFQQLFVALGSLDQVLLDFYERTKTMTPDQREAEPLLSDEDHAALAIQYAARSNVSTETNRPQSMKGKGSDGIWRNIVGTFMGWAINMTKQFSKGLQSHSKDPQFSTIAQAMIGIGTIILLLAVVGAWNWEAGDWLSKLFYDVSSARVQIGNIQDWSTALLYFFQAIVNTVPLIGSSLGGLVGVAYTGRGNPFDMSSLSPHIGFMAGIYNTARRVIQTGDALLPLIDFTRQWIPMSKIVMNRFPLVRGLVDQQNAIRSMHGSHPPGTEIVWGKRGGGNAKYSPANDEVNKLVAAAYDAAAHGGSVDDVRARLAEALAAYVATGRTEPDAQRALSAALSAKEPIRALTGREMTAEEEKRWVSRMTPAQKADYDRAVAAFKVLSDVTGRDLNMVTQPRGTGGGGGGGRIPSRAIGVGSPMGSSGGLNIRIGSGISGIPSGFGPSRGGGRSRSGRSSGTTRRRRSTIGARTTRRLGPSLGRSRTRRRRNTLGTRRRRSYALA